MSYLIRGLPRTTLPPLTAFSQDDWGRWCTAKLQNLPSYASSRPEALEPSPDKVNWLKFRCWGKYSWVLGLIRYLVMYGFCFSFLKASSSTVQQLTRRKNGQSRSGTWETGGLAQIYCCELIQAFSPLDFISPWPSRIWIFLLFVGILMLCISQRYHKDHILNGICRVMPSTKQFPIYSFLCLRVTEIVFRYVCILGIVLRYKRNALFFTHTSDTIDAEVSL